MFRRPLIKEFIFLSVLTATLHIFAIYNYLYWSISEFDSFMHFLGGALVVMGTLWFYFFSGFFMPKKRTFGNFFLISMLGLIFIAVAWEIFEIVEGVTFVAWQEYAFDTTLDFIMDFLGAMVAFLYAFMREIPEVNKVTVSAVNSSSNTPKLGEAPDNLPI